MLLYVKSDKLLKVVIVVCLLFIGITSIIDFIKSVDTKTVTSECSYEYKSNKLFFLYITLGSLLCAISLVIFILFFTSIEQNIEYKNNYFRGFLIISLNIILTHTVCLFVLNNTTCYFEQKYLYNTMLFANSIVTTLILSYIRFFDYYKEIHV